ncbi:GFA family protein [Paracoccus methylarcula]|uniref:GFA family protein n=1 Tax=Paracoccus methylarcula TaxID=72022 RepID=A0A3R7SC32_9RHOB|nr:GFA family protein [Paracoccus methylarcula]RNF33427.1 GFA family protein [Paracoccus methylarcula]
MGSEFTGHCLCGAVRFRGQWEQAGYSACHCGQCRRWSGHIWAGADASDLSIEGVVKWYRSSDEAERGFCPECGSSLFWRRIGADRVAVGPGAVDEPTGLHLTGHIFVADKGDSYEIADGLPQEARE